MVSSDQIFVLCQAALVFALTRWLLSLALNLLIIKFSNPSSSCCSSSSSSSSSSPDNLRTMTKNLSLTTLENIEHMQLSENADVSCAICLNTLKKKSQVWELSNCIHVFHKHCLEKWVLYDDRFTCPLCRAPVVAVPRAVEAEQPPSWAVERMLYLFGDDLLP